MADDPATSTGRHHHGVSKFLSRDRWRSKSNADETANLHSTDQNVADFLRPNASTKTRPSVPVAPRIDIAAAQKWTQSATGNGMSTPSSLRGRGGSQKKPRKPNLTVEFSTTNEIIGEGGEECEAPTMEISAMRRAGTQQAALARSVTHKETSGSRTFQSPPRPTRSMTSHDDEYSGYGGNDESDGARAAAYRSLFGEDPQDLPPRRPSEDNFVPQSLKRAATGYSSISDNSHARESLSSTYSDPDSAGGSPARTRKAPTSNPYQLPEFNSLLDDSPIDFYLSSDRDNKNEPTPISPVEQHSRIQRMRQEEGRVLHQNARMSIIELAEEDLSNLSLSDSKPPPQSFASSKLPTNPGFKPYSPVDDLRQKTAPGSTPSSATDGRKAYTSAAASYKPSPVTPTSTTSVRENRLPKAYPQPNPSARKPVTANPTLAPSGRTSQSSNRPSPSPLTIPQQEFLRNESRQSDRSHNSEFRTPATASSIKPPTSGLSQAAYEDFSKRCEHMRGIFRLQAEFEKPMSEYRPNQWLRAAAWWIVRGRSGMEAIIRGRPRSADGQTPGSARPQEQLLTQPHVDLAKCWWILAEVIPFHAALPPSNETSFTSRAAAAVSANDSALAEFFDSCELVQGSLKGLLSSMSRNHAMPPYNALIQGQDQTIWVQYPPFSADMLPILSGTKRSLTGATNNRSFDPLSVIAVADTKRDFVYYRWFTQVTISAEDNDQDSISLLCIFSVMRARNDWHPKVAICTQKELVTICITGERKLGPSWEDVKWSEQDSSLQIKLAQGYMMNAQLSEQDYHTLANMYKKAFSVQTSLFPLENEQVVFEVPLEDFQFNDTMRPPAFPQERMRRCRVRVFAKSEVRAEGVGSRRFYRGIRFLVVTSPKNRVLADTSHDLGVDKPMVVEMLTESIGGENFPAMALHIKEEHRQCSLFMVFSQLRERQTLHSALNEAELAPEEMQYAALRLKKLGIEPTIDSEDYAKAGNNPLGRMNWQELCVVNKDPHNPDDDFGQVVGSDSLRIISQGAGGTITDRVNLGKTNDSVEIFSTSNCLLGPGEFKIKLTSDGTPGITILRAPQDDLSMTFDRRVAPFTMEQVDVLHAAICEVQTKRTFAFYNLEDLHTFQFAITGFKVKYEGLARDFTIARRRPVTALSKHKRLETGLTRIQVVSHDNDKLVQLLAFFENGCTWAEALGFVLKGVDVFERYDVKGKVGVRLVDAKFTLPRMEKSKSGTRPEDIDRGFVCLDMPEVPGENDDIWIGFDDNEGKPTTAPGKQRNRN
jgi:hypothetical protein